MSEKRRRVTSDSATVQYDTYCIKSIAASNTPLTNCLPNYQMYDISSALEASRPPCHPASFLFNSWEPTDVVLLVGDQEFRAHKNHLKHCCRYFEGMFGNNMKESNMSEITIHGVDEECFRAILASFYTGFLSLCSECVVRFLRTGTYLLSEVILNVCENYILSHVDLSTVFQYLHVSCELNFPRITNQALKLICVNLGAPGNLCETEEFLGLAPSEMSRVIDANLTTNISETELAQAVLRWAALRYDALVASLPSSPQFPRYEEPCSSSSSLETTGYGSESLGTRSYSSGSLSSLLSFNDSGVNVSADNISTDTSDDYVVEILDSSDDAVDLRPSPPLPGISHLLQDRQAFSNDFNEGPSYRRNIRTYQDKSKSKRSRKGKEPAGEERRGCKRKREEEVSSREATALRQEQKDLEEVLLKIEYGNMEIEALRSFLGLDVVNKLPNLYTHLRRLATTTQYKCRAERGSNVAISLCYNRAYRISDNPTRTVILYYFFNNRWHVLNNTFNINLTHVKSLVKHDFLYLFGMQKLPGLKDPIPRAYRFNQFTGYWREISPPIHPFNNKVKCLSHGDTILLIGTQHSSGTTSFQQSTVSVLQYTPVDDTWRYIDLKLPINNYQLSRFVSSIISHNGLLYYVSRNKLYSYNLDGEVPIRREVAVISPMFTDISNYWLFAYQDRIIIMGGICNVQGGGSWENKELLIYNLSTKSWAILQNHKPSPMYEMMSGMVYQDKIYTVGRNATGTDNVAKMELFDLTRYKWKKGTNIRYESAVHCTEFDLTVGCMLVKSRAEES